MAIDKLKPCTIIEIHLLLRSNGSGGSHEGVGRKKGVATEDANAFSRLAESALFCANFTVAPAGLICLACATLLAVMV